MAKKGSKSGKAKGATGDTSNDGSGFTIAGIDIPAALRSNGVTVDALTRHPLVAGLAAMALESLASQIRAKTAAHSVSQPAADREPKPAAKRKTVAKADPAKAAKKQTPKKAGAKPATKKATATKPAPAG